MRMEAIKKVAAVGVLLCGVSFAGPIAPETDEGKFVFTVEDVTTINCKSPEAQDAQTEAISKDANAKGATAKIVCTIETNSQYWGVSVVAQHGGKLVNEYGQNLQIDHLDANLAIFSTLKSENDNAIKITNGLLPDPYDDATTITADDGVAKTIDDGNEDYEFKLEELFGTTPGDVFIGYGPVKATLTVEGAPQSQTTSTAVTSGNGAYEETLIFTVAGIVI